MCVNVCICLCCARGDVVDVVCLFGLFALWVCAFVCVFDCVACVCAFVHSAM